jgi:probable phosphoglycerate mutase
MRIYLIRHGDPVYSTDSLTPAGKLEAEALAGYLTEVKPDRLYTSPLGRARETASYAEQALGMTAEVLEWTRELNMQNDICKGSPWDIPPPQLKQLDAAANPLWQEQVGAVGRNSDNWLQSLGWEKQEKAYHSTDSAPSDKELQLAVFCHGGFGLTWLAHLLDIPVETMWRSFFLHTSSITTILFEEREPGMATPRVISMSALPHLAKANLPPSQAGIKANYY